ncbi:MAG: hypothetical protein LBM75_09150 [Myxococcales bacterium]|nr:hypothetical protein [Myxococcales bacterium]
MTAIQANGRNLFTDGNPQAGRPATIMTARWANVVQEELANLLEKSGVTLDSADDAQILKLWQRLNKPPLGFGDYTEVVDGELVSNVAASCECISGVLLLPLNGKLRLVVGNHCSELVDLDTTFSIDNTWMIARDSTVSIAQLATGSVTLWTFELQDGVAGAVSTKTISLAGLSGIAVAPSSSFAGAFDSATGDLVLAVAANADLSSGGISLGRIKPTGDWELIYGGFARAPETICAIAIDSDHLAFAAYTPAGLSALTMARTKPGVSPGWSGARTTTGLGSPVQGASDFFTIGGPIKLRWAYAPDSAVTLLVLRLISEDQQMCALIRPTSGLVADVNVPPGHHVLDVFRFQGNPYCLAFKTDFTGLAFYAPTPDGTFSLVRAWEVSPGALTAGLSAVAFGAFPGTIASVTDSLVLVAIRGVSWAMTDPIYAPLVRSLVGNHIVPIALLSDGRRLAWENGPNVLWATTKLS